MKRSPFMNPKSALQFGFILLAMTACSLTAQESPQKATKDKDTKAAPRGSILEDRAARQLLEAGDARLEAGESAKALEVWQSVIERYPRSRIRHDAHLRLGDYLLKKERSFDRARTHFESVAIEENPDEAQRAEATLKIGICFFEARNFGKCFQAMRSVIEQFPVSSQVNEAYYYIGLGHFQQGHYSRAISALERVGTALPPAKEGSEKPAAEVLEAGKRLFIRVEDADLAALDSEKTVPAICESASGDKETVPCVLVGRNVRVVIGSIPTALGTPKPGNGILELRGGDTITIRYTDSHTADGNLAKEVTKVVPVVGTATAAVMDGAYGETLQGVVLGRGVNLQVLDADFDKTDGADVLKATVEVLREKTPEELAAEDPGTAPEPAVGTKKNAFDRRRFRTLDKLDIVLTEAKVVRATPTDLAVAPPADGEEAAPKAEPKKEGEPAKNGKAAKEDTSIHSGAFRAVVTLEKSETPNLNDDKLQALPNDLIVVTYQDEKNANGEPSTVVFTARCVEGSLGSVRVSQTQIADQELRVKTQLKTAGALTNIGNRYKEFGLRHHADLKYKQALELCEEIQADAKKLGGRTLEETYVQLWKIYFEMDNLALAAAISERLQREFPNSEFADAALISLGDVARKQKEYRRAIGIYANVLRLDKSALRGEAQYFIAECYEELAKAADGNSGVQLFDQAFQEYKKVFDKFPDSGRVGEAVSKMANYYYQQKDYARAIDVFESVLHTHPDAKFLDVILFNYGRCLYRMEKRAEARRQFDQLIADFPESPLAPDAKKISDALRKAAN